MLFLIYFVFVYIILWIYACFCFQGALLQHSLCKSLEEDVKKAALHEKSLEDEIKSLKSQLVAKEKERVETVETLHAMETRCRSVEAKLQTKTEEFDNLKKELTMVERERKST